MAIPKNLKALDADKAKALIEKHLKAGTGDYEHGPYSDFVYKQGTGYVLIRECFGRYETGKVSM